MIAILNFTDLHDAFCEVCGDAGLVMECLELSEQLKKATPEFDEQKVCSSTRQLTKNISHYLKLVQMQLILSPLENPKLPESAVLYTCLIIG